MPPPSAEYADASELDEAWAEFKENLSVSKSIECLLSKRAGAVGAMSTKEFAERARATVEACRRSHAAHVKAQPQEDLSDERVLSYCRYTDGLPLKDYENTLELVPGLVNLVSLAEAVPIDGSSLPFNLKAIAVKCRNAVYFAPRRFTAIQLAFDSPRSRVLLFRMHRLPLTLQARLSVQSQDTNRRFLRVCAHRHWPDGWHRLRRAFRRKARRDPRCQDHFRRGGCSHRHPKVCGTLNSHIKHVSV